MTPFSTEKWVSGTRSGYSMCSSPSPAAARHLVPTCPHTALLPSGPAAGTTALLSAESFPLSRALLKECIVCAKGRTRVAHYRSELLSDKWATKSVLTSLRCSWTRSLLSLTRVYPCEDRMACGVTKAWIRRHQLGSFQPHRVFLNSVSWELRHFMETVRRLSLQTFLEGRALSSHMKMNLSFHCSEYFPEYLKQSFSTIAGPSF